MAGRGRDQTLPAWMTQGPGGPQGGGHHGPPGGQPGWRPPGMNQGGPGMLPQINMGPPPRAGPGGLMGPGPGPQMRPPYGQPQPQQFPGMQSGAPPGLMQGPGMGFPPPGGPSGSMPAPQQGLPPGLGGMPLPPAHAMGPRPGMGAPQVQHPMHAAGLGHLGPGAGGAGQALPGPPAVAQQPSAQPAPAPAAAAPQQGAPASGAKPRWTAHTAPDGRTYFYNRETKKSVWSKPPDFDTPAAVAEPAKPVAEWKEFTAPDGRKYYYNKATNESKWTNPEAAKASPAPAAAPSSVQVVKLSSPQANGAAAAAAASPLVAAPLAQTPIAQPSALKAEPAARVESVAALERKSSTPEPAKPIKFMYTTKEEAKEAFKELLVATNVASDWTWENTMRKIIADPRYSALKSLGEKKACFKEYQDARVKTEKEEARQKAKQAKEDFTTMLEKSDELPEGTRWSSKVARLFDLDPRWKALDSERLREELFSDHMKERDRKVREARKAEQKKHAADFKELLESVSYIKASSSWRKVQPRLEGEPAFEACDKVDRLEVFQAHLKHLEKAEREALEKEKAERMRKERQNRDAFRELLLSHAGEGKIHAKLRWKEYYEEVRKHKAYLAVEGNKAGSRPKELFADVIEEVEERYTKERGNLRDAIRRQDFHVGETTTVEQLTIALAKEEPELADIQESHRKLVLEEIQGRQREKAAQEAERAKKSRDALASLMRHSRDITEKSSFEDAQDALGHKPEFKAVKGEVVKEVLAEVQEALAAKAESRKSRHSRDEDRDKHKKRHKKDHKEDKHRSKRHHSEESEGEEKRSKRHRKDKDRRGSESPDSPREKRRDEDGEL